MTQTSLHADLLAYLQVSWQLHTTICKKNQKNIEEYGIVEFLELAVIRCGRWMGNRNIIWSGLIVPHYENVMQKNQIVRINA